MQDFTPVDSVPELIKEDRVEGTGAVVEPSDTVTCHYTGAVAKTGEVFQTSFGARAANEARFGGHRRWPPRGAGQADAAPSEAEQRRLVCDI